MPMTASDASSKGRKQSAARRRAVEQQSAGQRVLSRWAGRGKEVAALVGLLGAEQPPVDIFVYGGSSTGKTAVVRDVCEELCLNFVYVDCKECPDERRLLEALAAGMQSQCRDKDLEYKAQIYGVEQLHAFIRAAPDLLTKEGDPAYLVMDNIRCLSNKDVLAPLLRLRELTGGCNIGVILISSVGWENLCTPSLAERPPVPVLFRPYDEQTIIQILVREREEQAVDAGFYASFVRGCMSPFIRCSRNLNLLHTVAAGLFAKYKTLTDEGSHSQGDVQRMHKVMRPHIQEALDTFQGGIGISSMQVPGQPLAASGGLEFELPYMSKFLLLAAFIASRNSLAADKRTFDTSAGRGKRRRITANQTDKQTEAAKEALLAGPKRFSSERLLAVLWGLLSSETEGDSFCSSENVQSSDIFTQLSAVTSLRLLSKVHAEEGLTSCEYQCNVTESLAHKLARNLKVELNKYLVYV
eukprot:jgi/Tetstr1/460421/TSEL_005682.t1